MIETHRMVYKDEDVINPALLDWAKAKKLVVRPEPFQIVAFSTAIPHCAYRAFHPQYRGIMNFGADVDLPPRWQDRVRAGDTPQWKLGLP